MTHILVKWIDEEKWDVYPLSALVDPKVGLRLLTDSGAIEHMRGSVVDVYWKEGEEPSPAELLYFGKECALEKKRSRFAARTARGSCEYTGDMSQKSTCRRCEEKETTIQELRQEVTELKQRLNTLGSTADAARMVKRLRKTLSELQTSGAGMGTNIVACGKVDIGSGVLLEQTTLDRLWKVCNGSATKYARALLRCVFEPEELKGKSLYGQPSNAHKNLPTKEGLDPLRLGAVLGYTHGKFPAISDTQLKSSLSSLLSRELK
ncbi:uncharacterized protein LOC135387190 [Ornithodoros turicata]|uniref:uncharacterized protein LOC135387190 n=1 Tax=Ornithodoros turicata TaxID=34597 RepID=UPI003138E995